jgi:hypothetical protein
VLQKQPIAINFAQGLDTKTDPWQVAIGKYLALDNSVFTKGGQLQKRNGYASLPALPNTSFSYLTTLNDNLTALGPFITAYSAGSKTWVSKGAITPLNLSTLPLIRNNLNQTQADSAVAPNGIVCTVYAESNGSSTTYKYAIADSTTGQNLVNPTAIPVSSGTVTGAGRVFLLGNYFVIAFTNTISATAHLQYIAIPIYAPATTPTANADLAGAYATSNSMNWDAQVYNNNLYVAFATSAPAVKIGALSLAQAAAGSALSTTVSFAPAATPTALSLCMDTSSMTNPIIYVSYYSTSGTAGYTLSVYANPTLATNFTAKQIISTGTVLNLTSAAQNGVCTVFAEYSNFYPYNGGTIPTRYVGGITVSSAGTVGTLYTVVRSVGLGSKAFIVLGVIYFLGAFQSPYQPSYFLINGSTSTQAAPIVVARLAYENGGGYVTLGLPNVTVTGTVAQLPYLNKDLVQALSNSNSVGTATVGGVYSQTGVNLASFNFTQSGLDSAEIGNTLQFGGGFLWTYDGYLPTENNFFLWPEPVFATTVTTGGSLAADTYYYQAVYEWADNQGNIYRSAGSIPCSIATTGSTSLNNVYYPTLRLTYKVSNPVKITLYRWSSGQPIWYQVTSITSPTLNDTTIDYNYFVDTQSNAAISGNPILYTTGGVIEDTSAPATNLITLFDDRLWMVDAEDTNLLWFSKQVIEATPVEMSDLLTLYVAPTQGAQGSTGPITAIAPMDDKLIIFKANALYYVNGTGPDNTGSQNQYSQPIFITATVGCANQQSIVFMPSGLMFQSDKGIWLLGRDLSTKYIGAAVEKYNASTVQSAVNVPTTNQVRFTLSTGQTLMYDYYYEQWGTFSGVTATSSTVFQGLHTFINSFGQVYQESPGVYLDGSEPVNMSFTTSWLNLAGLQGYQRAYFFYLLGSYITPHKLQLGIAYDYNPNVVQVSTISPSNYSSPFGSGTSQDPFGQGTPFGGSGTVEQWRVFLAQQRCQSLQITLTESYDASNGVPAGAGLTLSGINLIAAFKSPFRPIGSGSSVGGGVNRG